ncbi:MAG: FGGY family carbohydrate kinase [Caldilineaceae bacterium]
MEALVLAVDVGSTWCKAGYLDRQGHTVAAGRAYTRDIPVDRDVTLARFWDACQAAIRAATAQLPAGVYPAAISIATRALFGVCITHQGEACLPGWDAKIDRTTSPQVQAAYAAERWGEKDPAAYGYAMWQAGFLLWLKATRPTDWRAIRYVGALHDYLVYALTGVWVTDPTSGPGQSEWPAEIISISGLPPTAFPQILEPQQVAGQLTAAAGQVLGLPADIPVVTGLHDGTAANYGVRAMEVGDACLNLSTNFVLRAVNGPRLPPPATGYKVAADRWAWVNNVGGAATQLDIVAQCLRPDLLDVGEGHAHLGHLAAAIAPGAEGCVLPLVRPGAEADLHLAVHQARQDGYADGVIYRAGLEAVAWGVHELVQRAQGHGARPQRYIATGGSSQNAALLRVLAAILAAPIACGPAEGGVLGAAMAAAVGAGWYATMDAAMRHMSTPGSVIQPNPVAVEAYAQLLQFKGG